MQEPVNLHTQMDGVDLVFSKDGYAKILVHYRMYLLRYNGSGEPIACTCPALLDLLHHFPQHQPLLYDNDSSSVSDFGDDKVDMEEEAVIAGTEAESKSDKEVASVTVEQIGGDGLVVR
ncbi:hypothetical protein ACA910_018684 [Epithemia clementina (nom. ined.)]